AEVEVAIAFANVGGVIPTGLAIAVRSQVRVARDAELCGHTREDGGGHICWVGLEGAEESGGDDLQGQAQAVVIAAPIGKELAIGVVEIEVARELRRSRLAGVAAIAPSLVVSEEFDRH